MGDKAEATPYLHIIHVTKTFGELVALNDVSLDIYEGEFVCLLGPSGCGKTTLLRIIAGLEQQNSGEIHQGGKDISRLPPRKRDFGIVFQSYALFPNLTAYQNVAYGLENRRLAKQKIAARVQELLDLIGLPDVGHKYPSQLSGGQQQRIALARALATSPGLLLLDEPLSALDARVRVSLRLEIKHLQHRLGVTTVFVTHDQEEALVMADRIVVMNQGYIEQIGTPREVYTAPRSIFVMNFVGGANFLEGRLRRSPSGTPTVTLRGGVRLTVSPTESPDGDNVVVGVRLEDARIDVEGKENRLRGRVDSARFVGGFVNYGVTLDNGATLVSKALTAYVKEPHQVGDDVTVAFAAENTRVFPYPRRGLLREIEAI